jgi:hypothetical protein
MRFVLAVLFSFLAAGVAIVSAPAQTMMPSPLPSPSSTPYQGFSAVGALSIASAVNGAPVTFSANVAVANNKRETRVDLLSINVTGNDPNSTVLKSLLPQGAITFVIDQNKNLMTVWNAQKRVYYQSKMQKPMPSPSPSATSPSKFDIFFDKASALASLDSFNESLVLVGHQPVNGHPAAMFHFILQSQKHNEDMQEVDADIAFADDLGGIPLRLWATLKGAHPGDLKFDVASLTPAPPKASVFAIPVGYKKVSSILAVMSANAGAFPL